MFNVHHAKTHFSKLLSLVIQGENVIIAKAGVPIAKIVPISINKHKRTPGALEGKITISDDFNDPLPDDILTSFGE